MAESHRWTTDGAIAEPIGGQATRHYNDRQTGLHGMDSDEESTDETSLKV